mmetsp:Transcript_26166/g.37198  ORF Transcript_26166/g.37198 Transcript_26166/m.37198 type:complete len:87 (+) Transcript_26166:30-290(+)
MTDGQKERLFRERAAYRESRGLPPRRNTREEIASLRSEIASLRSEQSGTVPAGISGSDNQSQISQVTTGTQGRSIIEGRNQRQRQN